MKTIVILQTDLAEKIFQAHKNGGTWIDYCKVFPVKALSIDNDMVTLEILGDVVYYKPNSYIIVWCQKVFIKDVRREE